ncbi:hypothetical protein SCOR_24915 [Sulfidibacter corallicola]|uniref:GAF domain-containing protein n=1 Tax=Sulfidibacter corallicola TaxID=2818388 RepID=A0A8A4TQU5_SULCO|nr:hypothetical protein [Sulfidibacter corallicola]QTD52349.1 hypothetical protein J3U87_07740 [Sulfidibacter corallicola]
MGHHDRRLYQNAMYRSGAVDLTHDDLQLITSAMKAGQEYAISGDVAGIAEKILAILKLHPHFNGVDRVCLARKVGHTNQLLVLDSSMIPIAENLMGGGYRCYVDAHGSLFSLKAGEMRILHDVTEITDSYHLQSRPVQRSLRYIGEMGFRSGLCIPCTFKDELLGYLFMNSSQPIYFHLPRNQDYLIYSQLVQIATSIIQRYRLPASYEGLPELAYLYCWDSRIFNTSFFAKHLTRVLTEQFHTELPVEVTAAQNIPTFLYSPTMMVFFVWHALVQLQVQDKLTALRIHVEPTADGDLVGRLGLEGTTPHAYLVPPILEQAQAIGYRAEVSDGTLSYYWKKDEPARGRTDILYSV